ncbi:MAG: PAC2 family protein [Nitriliruptoraceae bacterium]
MNLLTLERSLELVGPDPVLVVAFDGWTDAGEGGTAAADALRDAFEPIRLGAFASDALYDYRDRRPALAIDQGVLSRADWPEVVVELLEPPSGPPLLLVGGPEPDLGWRTLAADLVELARLAGASRYVGFGSVPGPIPHTRPVHLIATSNDPEVLERIGRPHEQVVVPASCQVALEAELAAAGLQTLGLWVRIPHYVAGEYPEAARALLEQLTIHLGTPIDLSELDEDIADNRARLDVAAEGSEEVREHVLQLERLYDAELQAERLSLRPERAPDGLGALSEEHVPSADALAAEIERFLQGRKD